MRLLLQKKHAKHFLLLFRFRYHNTIVSLDMFFVVRLHSNFCISINHYLLTQVSKTVQLIFICLNYDFNDDSVINRFLLGNKFYQDPLLD